MYVLGPRNSLPSCRGVSHVCSVLRSTVAMGETRSAVVFRASLVDVSGNSAVLGLVSSQPGPTSARAE